MSFSTKNSLRVDGQGRQTGDLLSVEEIIRGIVNSTQDAIQVSGVWQGFSSKVSIVRPSNTTAYTAGDVIGTDAGTAQVETATAAGTITPGTAQVETATAVGTVTPGVQQVETATAAGTITAGTAQVETATAVGTITGLGNATVVVTSALFPTVTLSVAVANGDTAATWAARVRAALAADATVSTYFTVGGTTTDIILTAINAAANDATLNISLANGTCTGITNAPTSADTTAGVAPGTGNATVTVTSALIGSTLTLSVPVTAGDTAATWAGKVRTALAASASITPYFTVGGSTTSITLTRIVPTANDATLNIALANGTCTGITAAPTSADTTAGVAPGTGIAIVTVTATGLAGSPLSLNVPVVAGDTAATWAGKVRTVLGATPAITSLFTVGGTTTSVALTAINPAANDSALNIALFKGSATGITDAPTSTHSTAGVAPGTGNATVTVTGSDIPGSPIALSVPVTAGDTAATWAGKVRTALVANSAITGLYTVGGSTTSITLTRIVPTANDATLNIALANGTCTGITAAPTSADTTAGSITTGVAGSAIIEFKNIGPAGGHVLLTNFEMYNTNSAVPSGMTTFELELYDTAPDAIVDNAPYVFSSTGDRGKYLTTISLGAPAVKGSTLVTIADQVNKVVKLASGSTSLFGLLKTLGGYTPASGTTYSINAHGVSV